MKSIVDFMVEPALLEERDCEELTGEQPETSEGLDGEQLQQNSGALELFMYCT